MMKRYLLLSFVCLSAVPTCMQARSEKSKNDALVSAIENVEVKLVEKLLKREGIADNGRKKLLLEAAEDAAERSEENISLLRNGWDCARFAGWTAWSGFGAFTCLTGTVLALAPVKDKNKREIPFLEDQTRMGFSVLGVFAALCTVPGIYYLKKAWKCPHASRRLESARMIEDLIKKAPLSTENKDLNIL
ncbi:hypothetical protein H0X06_01340 [Candidatus Dependentiae bacterium]|nr:hypothetical protein [Candidatus Dependentiae bacterium]